MPIVLDPDKSLVSLSTYFIEEVRKHGNSVFHFIRSRDDFDEWKSKGYVAEDALNPDQPKPENIISKLVTHWRTVSWKDNNTILSRSIRQSIRPDGTPTQEIDAINYRDLKLKTCLKRWSLTDDNGRPVEVNDQIIDSLDPSFANELLTSFEKITEPSADDLKN